MGNRNFIFLDSGLMAFALYAVIVMPPQNAIDSKTIC
jgi:hypothetical protein